MILVNCDVLTASEEHFLSPSLLILYNVDKCFWWFCFRSLLAVSAPSGSCIYISQSTVLFFVMAGNSFDDLPVLPLCSVSLLGSQSRCTLILTWKYIILIMVAWDLVWKPQVLHCGTDFRKSDIRPLHICGRVTLCYAERYLDWKQYITKKPNLSACLGKELS